MNTLRERDGGRDRVVLCHFTRAEDPSFLLDLYQRRNPRPAQ